MNYLAFQKSISNELIATKDRVRNIIENRHWGEEGRYKEVILIENLKKRLPKNISVGTGFIINHHLISTQIDIIIYRNEIPIILQQGDFVIVPSDAVMGVIEVKTHISPNKIEGIIDKAARVNVLFEHKIFNGVFSFDNKIDWKKEHRLDKAKNALIRCKGVVNYICFGQNYFAKHWDARRPSHDCNDPHYSFYRINDLAFGYFISNLIEDIYNMSENHPLPQTLNDMFYPIESTKEAYRFDDLILPSII